MKFIFNNMVRDVGCGFRRKCGTRSCCIIRHESPWATSVPSVCATVSSLPSRNRNSSMPTRPGDSTGICAGYRVDPADALWLSPTMPSTIMRFCTRRGEKHRSRSSSCCSFRPTVRISTPSNGYGNLFVGFVSIIDIFPSSRSSPMPLNDNSLSGDREAKRFSNSVLCLNMRNYIRRCV